MPLIMTCKAASSKKLPKPRTEKIAHAHASESGTKVPRQKSCRKRGETRRKRVNCGSKEDLKKSEACQPSCKEEGRGVYLIYSSVHLLLKKAGGHAIP